MRVVAGSAGGIHLQTPKTDLRPTMDLVRGAIFSSLGEFVQGARVLDLFAGTGALGIEALSRGAASAVFVDSDPRAIAAIQCNLAATHLDGTVQRMDVFRFLDRVAPPAGFDLALADPPYAKTPGARDFAIDLLACPALRTTLAPHGVFVLEHLPDADLPFGQDWECFRQKHYGATAVAFLRPRACENLKPET